MKRSFESESQEDVQDKMPRVTSEPILNELSTNSSISVENTTFDSSSTEDDIPPLIRQDNIYPLIFTDIEKQVVRHSLAMIGRSNTSDWNFHISNEQDNMVLRESCIIASENMDGIGCENITEISCCGENTYCKIRYRLDTQEHFSEIFYDWNNYDDYINFQKTDTISYYIVFSRTITRQYSIIPRNTREDSWCYFRDARSHLNSLRIF